MKKLHKLVLRNVSNVIAVASAVEATIKDVFPNTLITCIPNGIEIEKWADVDGEKLGKEFRSEHSIPNDALLVGTIGELKKLKGQEDFIIAAAELAKIHPDAHFLIVGKDNSSDQKYGKELRRLVTGYDLEEKFNFLEWVDDTRPLLSSLDVFVSPSHSEALSLTIIEAMASGAAIVSTEAGGSKELIKNSQTGILTPIKEPLRLIEAISKLMENKETRETYGVNAQEFAKRKLSLERMIDATEAVYKKTLI